MKIHLEKACAKSLEKVKIYLEKVCTQPLESEDSLGKGVYLVVRK